MSETISSEATWRKRVRQRAARDFTVARRWLSSGPANLALSVSLIVVFIVSLSLGRETLEPEIAAGAGHSWWTFLTAFTWVRTPLQLVTDVVLLLTVGILLERIVGSVAYLAVGLGSYWLGAFLTVWCAELIDRIDPAWGDLLEQQEIVGVAALLIGVAVAASVRMSALWRQRVRVLVLVILVMMLAFAGSLGTLFTLITALLGIAAGYALWGGQRDAYPAVMTGPHNGRALVAIIVGGIVVGTLISMRSPEMIGALAPMKYTASTDPVTADVVAQICATQGLKAQCAHYSYLLAGNGTGATLLALLPLVAQLVLAWGLWRGRAAAWWGTVILQGLTAAVAISHLLVVSAEVREMADASEALGFNDFGHPTARLIVPIVVPALILILMAVKRNLFTVKALPGTYTTMLRSLGFITLATLLVTLIIGVSIGATRTFLSTVWVLTTDFFIRLLPSSVLSIVTPQMTEESMGAMTLMSWAPIVPWVAFLVLLTRSFSSQFLQNSISRTEYAEIVRTTEAGSMGWITTWEDNQYWKSSRHNAAVAYRAYGSVALTVSDPAAQPEDLGEVIEEFVAFAHDQGLIPAFYSVHAPTVSITDGWQWSRLQVAEETVLPLADLEFKGKKFQDIRTALNRATKEGIRTEWTTYAQCRPAYLAQIKEISSQWVSDKPLPEMGFTLGGIAELDDPEVRILLAVDEQDTVHGVTSWMPIYEDGEIVGWTLDFMRRLTGGFRPVIEYLIASAALWAKENEYETLSLSGAPLARAQGAATEGSSAQVLDSVLDILGETLEPVYGFRSLLRFKAKFLPEYVPIYLAVPTVAELPTVGLAIAHAYLPSLSLKDTVNMAGAIRQK